MSMKRIVSLIILEYMTGHIILYSANVSKHEKDYSDCRAYLHWQVSTFHGPGP
jgi:hypothetical protein